MDCHFPIQGVFSTQGSNLGLPHCGQTLYHLNHQGSPPYTKINSKWIKYLNVRPETIQLLEENIGRIFDDINQSKIPYDSPPRVMEIKAEVNKWDLINLKAFAHQRKL